MPLDFECPACGEPGTVPVSRLGHQLFCRVCAAKFMIDGKGPVLIGDQAPEKKPYDHRPPKKARADKINDRLERAYFFVHDIPLKTKAQGFALVAAAALLPWLANVLFFSDPLRAQSLRAVDALIHSNPDQLKALSTEKTVGEAIRWMDLVSPEVKQKIKDGARTRVNVASQDPKTGSATVMVYFDTGPSRRPRWASSAAAGNDTTS